MTTDPQKPERLIPALLAAIAALLVIAGLALWQRQGLAVWIEQAIAFCF